MGRVGGGPSTHSGWAFFSLAPCFLSLISTAFALSAQPLWHLPVLVFALGAEADRHGGKVLGIKSHSCSLGSRARNAHEPGWAGTLCSQGAHPFVLGLFTLCSGSCYPTAGPVRSSIPLTPTHHHGNTGSPLSQRKETGVPRPGVPEPPPQICRRAGQFSHSA